MLAVDRLLVSLISRIVSFKLSLYVCYVSPSDFLHWVFVGKRCVFSTLHFVFFPSF
jgi:hypothetical protein